MSLAAGSRLGPYEILGLLGAGGMGEVYRARDPRLGREVAIKLLPDAAGGPRASDRLLQEARAASTLNHENICTIHDVGEQDGRPFLVMELLRGRTLEARLAEGPVPVDDLLEWGTQVADALEAAHAKGILHRDIKPANLFLTERGPIKVLDFGLAKLTAAGGELAKTMAPAGLTDPGMAVGTVGYMSPEQALGKEVDARTDVFSLGAVLYQMATGRQAFAGHTTAAVYDAILHRTPASPEELNHDLPPALGTVILRALEKTPGARHASSRALRDELLRVAERGRDQAGLGAPSIAVLPFANMSADPENEYFTDGMAEEIINALCKIEKLRVASRTSSFAFKGRNEDVRKIGRTLNVTTVLEGSVRKSGPRLRITAQLVKVDDGYHLWSERYDRQLEDVFAVQDEISESIVSALRVVLSPREKEAIRKIPTKSMEAYDYYLRGLSFVHILRDQNLQHALTMFRRAVEVDPEFTLAWAGIVEACCWLTAWFTPKEEYRVAADEASARALAIDPDLAEAHVAGGLAASIRGENALARREFEIASRLDPRLWDAYYFHARVHFGEGNIERAAELFRKAFEVRPDEYQAPALLMTCLRGLGQLGEMRALAPRIASIIEKHLDLHPDDVRAMYFLASQWVTIGERDKGLAMARRALDMAPNEPGVRYNVACLYVNEGMYDEALDLLEGNMQYGWGNAEWLSHDPDMKPLVDHPRFRKLLEKMPERRNPAVS